MECLRRYKARIQSKSTVSELLQKLAIMVQGVPAAFVQLCQVMLRWVGRVGNIWPHPWPQANAMNKTPLPVTRLEANTSFLLLAVNDLEIMTALFDFITRGKSV